MGTGNRRRESASHRRAKGTPRWVKASHRRAKASHRRAMASRRRAMASHHRAMASHHRAMASRRRAMASRRRAMASRRRAMASRRRAMASRRRAMAPRHRAMASRRRAMASRRRAMASRRSAGVWAVWATTAIAGRIDLHSPREERLRKPSTTQIRCCQDACPSPCRTDPLTIRYPGEGGSSLCAHSCLYCAKISNPMTADSVKLQIRHGIDFSITVLKERLVGTIPLIAGLLPCISTVGGGSRPPAVRRA